MLITPLNQAIHQTTWQKFSENLKTKNKWQPASNPSLYQAWKGYWDHAWFARYFFPNHCRAPFSRMHTELFDLWSNQADRGRKLVVAAPRGHAKTTIMLVIQALHAICYQYDPYIVIVAQTRPEAESRVEQILDELRHNERLIQVFGHLAPAKGKGSRKKFTTTHGVTVHAMSRGESIRGLNKSGNRPSLVILDDVETLDGVQNPEQRQKTLDWFQKDVLPIGQIDGSSNFIVIGTCLHDESLISYLQGQPHWVRRKYRAVESWSTQNELWQQWTSILTDLTNERREEAASAFYEANQEAMLHGTQVLWPEVEPYHRLMHQLACDGRRAFFSEKQNEPFDPSEQLFNMETAHYFDWRPKSRTIRCANRSLMLEDLHTIVAFHDPSVGDSDQGDYGAIVVVGKDSYGYLYVLDAFIERCKPAQQVEAAVRLHERWQYNMLVLEGNNFQRLLVDNYNRRFANHPNPPRILKSTQTQNKKMRISSLQPYIEQGQLLFNRQLDQKLFEQMKYFPNGYHDDGPDALEGAVNKLLTRQAEPNIRPEHRRRNPNRQSRRPY